MLPLRKRRFLDFISFVMRARVRLETDYTAVEQEVNFIDPDLAPERETVVPQWERR